MKIEVMEIHYPPKEESDVTPFVSTAVDILNECYIYKVRERHYLHVRLNTTDSATHINDSTTPSSVLISCGSCKNSGIT